MRITVTLLQGELDYDIGMITHVIMNRETAAGATVEQGFNYANTSDYSGEVNLITRFEENAVNELRAAFGKYLVDTVEESDDNLEAAFGDHVFELEMPDRFNASYTKPIRSASHDFVVNRTLYDWFSRVKPNEASIYQNLYEQAMERLKGYLNRRTGMAKIKPWPAI